MSASSGDETDAAETVGAELPVAQQGAARAGLQPAPVPADGPHARVLAHGGALQEITASQSFSSIAANDRIRVAQAILAVMAGVLLAFAIGGVVLYLVFGRGPTDAPAAAKPAASAAPQPSVQATASASAQAAPSASEPAPLAPSDKAALAALEVLRSSLERCVKQLRQLPGTSPPVPASLAALKSGPYQPSPVDWRAPFFRCTEFKLESKMPFVLQWQFDRLERKGTGIAWLDDDADGVADRAHGFVARVAAKGALELGAIEPMSAATPPARAR